MSTRLIVRRALWHGGIAYPPNAIIECDNELDAVRLLESGRAELADPRDATKLKTFALGELRRVMQRAGPAPAPPGSPWVPWR